MEGNDQGQRELPDAATKQQIRLEEVRKARIDAEAKREKQLERRDSRKRARGVLKKIPTKVRVGIAAALVLMLVVFLGFALPALLDDDVTLYPSEVTLKKAVNVEDLTTVNYTYKGIAEKISTFLWLERVDYRVKYEAQVPVSYDMSAIEFSTDEGNKTVTAYLGLSDNRVADRPKTLS